MDKNNGNGIKKAEVRYEKILPGQFSDENIVVIRSISGFLTMILPSFFINESKKTIKVAIVAEESERYLVNLPNDTFTTGARVWFPKSEILV